MNLKINKNGINNNEHLIYKNTRVNSYSRLLKKKVNSKEVEYWQITCRHGEPFIEKYVYVCMLHFYKNTNVVFYITV